MSANDLKHPFVYCFLDTIEGFLIEYAVYSDEIIEPITGKLKVMWEG